jgi:hypothetical protein
MWGENIRMKFFHVNLILSDPIYSIYLSILVSREKQCSVSRIDTGLQRWRNDVWLELAINQAKLYAYRICIMTGV